MPLNSVIKDLDQARPEEDILRFAVLLFLGAFILRLAYVVFLRSAYPYFYYPSEDALYYQQWALKLASGASNGSDPFWGLPLYPYLLSLFYKMTGGPSGVVRVLHAGLGAFNCVLLYLFARKVFSERVARLAGFLMAGCFLMVYYDWLMNSVTLSILLGLLCAHVLIDLPRELVARRWFLAGILIGLLALVDGKAVFLVVLSSIYLVFMMGRKAWFRAFVLFLGFLLIVIAVSLRNKVVSGSWVFISAQTGLSLYVGNNAQATGIYSNPDFIRPDHEGQDRDQRVAAEFALGKRLSAAEVSDYWRAQAWGFVVDEPKKAAVLFLKKVRFFFMDHPLADDIDLKMQKGWRAFLDWQPFVLVCPLAFWGFLVYYRSSKEAVLVALIFIVAQMFFTMVFFLSTKHRVTVYPFFILGEALALSWFWEKLKEKQYKVLSIFSVCLALWMALFWPPRADARSGALTRAWKDGVIAQRRGDLKAAERSFVVAAGISPCAVSLGNLGSIYLQQNDPHRAVGPLEKAVALNAHQVDAVYNLGIAYAMTGREKEAEEKFRQVLGFVTDDQDALVRLGGLLDRQGRCAEVESIYATLVRLRPRYQRMLKDKVFTSCLK